MTQQFLRAYCNRETMQDQPGTPIRFVASTEDVARDGMVIEAAGWRLDSYNLNPVFLWAHDYSQPPIGKAKAFVENGKLVADVTFDQNDEFARKIEGKYRNEILNAVSVGWNTIEFKPGSPPRITEADLLDISAVPVPADPGALKERQIRALTDMQRWLDESSESPWNEIATAMVEVFTPGLDNDDTRKAKYNTLLPKYRRAGKTPPEFLALSEIALLSSGEIRGLFFNDEYPAPPTEQARIGAVLSARNRDDLEKSITLIQGVIERASKEQEPERGARAMDAGEMITMLNEMMGMDDPEAIKAMLAKMKDMLQEDDQEPEQQAALSDDARNQLLIVRLQQTFGSK